MVPIYTSPVMLGILYHIPPLDHWQMNLLADVKSLALARGGPRVSRDRSRKPTATGMGHHYSSPRKARDKRKNRQIVEVPGHDQKRARLIAELQALKSADAFLEIVDSTQCPLDIDIGDDQIEQASHPDPTPPTSPSRRIVDRKRCAHPDSEATRLYNHWKSLLPSLVSSLLTYQLASLGRPVTPVSNLFSVCQDLDCGTKLTTMQCLYTDRTSP
jgi:hypothetical protein